MPLLELARPLCLECRHRSTGERDGPARATGQPITPAALYEPIPAHARGNRVFDPGHVLRGDDLDLLAAPMLWIPQGLPTPDKRQAIARYVTRRRADVPEAPPDPTKTRILGLIPPEFRVRATKEYHDRAGRFFSPGDLADARDPFVAANPELFEPEQDSAA